MTAILDTATDGVVILDADGAIESVNASAEALFGLEAHEMVGRQFDDLLTPASRKSALDYLSGLRDSGVASLLNEGREVEAAAGRRLDPALHDHGADFERGGAALLRGASRHHALEADRGGADRGEARGGGRLRRRSRNSSRRVSQRDPHAAERHHRLRRGDDRGALRPGRERALPRISARHPRLRRARRQPRQRPPRHFADRGRQARA